MEIFFFFRKTDIIRQTVSQSTTARWKLEIPGGLIKPGLLNVTARIYAYIISYSWMVAMYIFVI